MTQGRHLNRTYATLLKAIIDNDGVECEKVPDWFFPQGSSMEMLNVELSIAKRICDRCPVKNLCAAYAIEAEEPFGIWGGLSPAERRITKRKYVRKTENPAE
jgi:WhiB family redox-sensing transcriptional regulator